MNPQPPVPGTPNRKGPSCWLIGGVGCVITIAVLMILVFVGMHQFMNSKPGQQIVSQMKSIYQALPDAIACEQKLTTVHEAIGRYHAKNGSYPPNLAALTPDYLPDPTECHCSLDSNTSPTHPTLVYTPPKPSSRPSDKVLAFTWTHNISIEQQTGSVLLTYYYNVAGNEMKQQTVTDSDGHTKVYPPVETGGSGAM
jgi:hypothetical protein